MNKIFWGLLFIFINISPHIGTTTFNIFPDFVGWIMVTAGLFQLSGESGHFAKGGKAALLLAVCCALRFAAEPWRSIPSGWLSFLLSFLLAVVKVYVLYRLTRGVADAERQRSCCLGGGRLFSAFRLLTVLNLLPYAAIPVPMLAGVLILAWFAAAAAFLITFYRTKKAYQDIIRDSGGRI